MAIETYLQLFWAPSIASAALIVFLWAQGRLSARAPLLLAWFVVALVAQYFGAAASAWWILGLVLQTALAVFLLFKHQFGQL